MGCRPKVFWSVIERDSISMVDNGRRCLTTDQEPNQAMLKYKHRAKGRMGYPNLPVTLNPPSRNLSGIVMVPQVLTLGGLEVVERTCLPVQFAFVDILGVETCQEEIKVLRSE
jgi:hypothetical protein